MKNKKAVGLRPFIISLVAIALFFFFMISFVGDYIEARNPTSEILNSKYGLNESRANLDDSIDQFSSLSEDIRTQLGSSEPSALEYTYLIFRAAFTIPYAFLSFGFNTVVAITNILFPTLAGTGLGRLLSIVLSVISSALIITLVLLIVKAIRSGESER